MVYLHTSALIGRMTIFGRSSDSPPPLFRDSMPPTLAALLCALSREPPPNDWTIDWPLFLRLAQHHRVLMRLSDSYLPDTIRVALAGLYRPRRIRALLHAATLRDIGVAFAKRGLPWIALKGAALSAQLLADPFQREARDIDLLAPDSHWSEAIEVLFELGYQIASTESTTEVDHELLLRDCKRNTLIELHRRLGKASGHLPLDRLRPWDDIVSVGVGPARVPTLALPKAVVYAAYHGCTHLWTRFSWLLDIRDATVHPDLDWREVMALAQTVGCTRHVALAATLAHRLLAAPMPSALTGDRSLMAWASNSADRLTRLFHASPMRDRDAIYAMGLGAYIRWDLDFCTSWRARTDALRHHLRPTPEDRKLLALPQPLAPLYYGLRVARIAARVVRGSPAPPPNS